MLQGQLQSYAASVEDDDDPRSDGTRATAGSSTTSRPSPAPTGVTIAQFFAKGMLMNVLAAMQYSIANEPNDSWAVRLAEGCREDDA